MTVWYSRSHHNHHHHIGKTSLIIRLTQDTFSTGRKHQAKSDTVQTQVDGHACILQFVDCEAEFLTSVLHKEQLQDFNAFLFVFDSEASVTEKMVNHMDTICEYATRRVQQSYPNERLVKEDIPVVFAFNNKSETEVVVPLIIDAINKKFGLIAPTIPVNAKSGQNCETVISQIVQQKAVKELDLVRRNVHCCIQ